MMKYVVLSVVALSLLATVSGRMEHVNEEKCELKQQYKKLQEAFEGYTQYNNLGHTGTLLNHEVWVSNVVLDFFSKKDALGFPLKSDEVTFTADDQAFVAQCGFMHDVGKAIPSDSPIKGIYRRFNASAPAEYYYSSADTPLPANTKTEVAPPCGPRGGPCEPRDFSNADRHNGVGYKIMLGLQKMPSAAAGGAPKPISELMTALGWSKEKQAICAIATFMHYWVADTTKNLVKFPNPVSDIATKEAYTPKLNEMWSMLRKAIHSAVNPASQSGVRGVTTGGSEQSPGRRSSLVELAEGPVKQQQQLQSPKKQTQGTLTPKATESKSSQSGTGGGSTSTSIASASASTSTSEGFEPMWKDLVSVTKQKLGVVDLPWTDKKVLMAALIIAVADGVGMVYSPSGPNSMAEEGSCLDISKACQADTPIYSAKQCQLVKDQRSVWHSTDAANFKLICDHLKENMGSFGELIKCDFPVPPEKRGPNEPKCSAC